MTSAKAGSAAALAARRSRHWVRIIAAMVWAGLSGAGYVAAIVGVWGLFAGWPVPSWALLTVVGGGFVASGMALPGVRMLSFLGSLRIKRDLREQILAHVNGLPLGWFTARSAGRVKQAVHDDVNELHGVFGETYVYIARWSVIATGGAVVFVVADPLFAIVAAVPAAVAVISTRRPRSQNGALAEASTQTAQAEATVNARSVEFVQGAEVWRVYPGPGDGVDRLAAALAVHERAGEARDAAIARDRRVLDLINNPLLGVLWVAVMGAVFAEADLLDPIALVPFVLLVTGFSTAVSMVISSRAELARTRVVARDYEGVLSEKPLGVGTGVEIAEAPSGPGAAAGSVAVELAGVTFGYESGHPVLTEVSVRAERGQTVALVGASGAGKSTIARLIPRFWDVDAGAVRVLGDDVRDLTATELYRRVAFVFQDVQLLHRTVAENIRLGDPQASDERVVAAARAAHIHDRILALPRGYESVVGEDAVFSGGEAQRVSIARALLLDAPVVVLDEATAHADAESEAAIHDAIGALTAGRTTLVIAHRLSTIQHADRIVVLEGGRVVEQGTFSELTDPSTSSGTGGVSSEAGGTHSGGGGVFARLWELQQQVAAGSDR